MSATGTDKPSEHASTNGPAVRTTPPQQPGLEGEPVRGKRLSIRNSWWAYFQTLLVKAGLDIRSCTLIFKGALAPTVALALFQWTSYADYFIGTGYLVVIIAELALPHLPRAKFLETLFMSVLFTCIGAAISMLAIFCAVKARDNHGNEAGGVNPGISGQASSTNYDASASAVIGVWLFVHLYIIGAVKASKPKWTMPCVIWSVYANVAMAYGPQMTTVAAAESFIRLLLLACLTGFGISAIVSLLVFPLTNRQLVFQDMADYISLLRRSSQMSLDFLHGLAPGQVEREGKSLQAGDHLSKQVMSLTALGEKMAGNLAFAKKEFAVGKMEASDIEECCRLLRRIRLPMVGLGCLASVLERITEDSSRHTDLITRSISDAIENREKSHSNSGRECCDFIRELRLSLEVIRNAVDEGLEHVLLVLQLGKSNREREADIEAKGSDRPRPGDPNFTEHVAAIFKGATENNGRELKRWQDLNSIKAGKDVPTDEAHKDPTKGTPDCEPLQQQLFVFIYTEFILLTVSRRLLDLMVAVDDLQTRGKLSKTKLLLPNFRPLRNWTISLAFPSLHSSAGQPTQKDPEHLPPGNAWERFGDQLRKISHFLASPASQFAFRVALGTTAVALVDFFEYSQAWYISNRLFWAQIMVAIGMNPTAGQGFRTFMLRVVASIGAYIAALVAWYIVDGQTAGVIVMFFIVMHAGVYVVLKAHNVAVFGLVAQAAFIIIVGYELQARKLGRVEATSNGQAYYPIYLLGAIRLADVAAGLFVAWFFTIFPFPIAEHRQIRKNLGRALLSLAKYYSLTHATMRLQLHGSELGIADVEDGYDGRLDGPRTKAYSQVNALVQSLQSQSKFLKWEIPMGGKFPMDQYQELTRQLQRCLDFMSLVSLASNDFHGAGDENPSPEWLEKFRAAVGRTGPASEQVTSLLSLLSAAVNGGYPLPPFLHIPQPWLLEDEVQVDQHGINVRHIAEPGYASFLIVLVATAFVHEDLKRLVAGVKNLVGELDFLYQLKQD
ncbi:hypothetical protein PRZ48_003539 [Zasmidium cellare]|uniref:ER transporter 6TM N-terminal domain-containing protein n=1 Tax=Zasmidium cellare TaxID=395010 RepID=A0ABR0EVC4_ZASCE|nr:hypothetical protein PRZ48_003539 [Zasmidium cellare]